MIESDTHRWRPVPRRIENERPLAWLWYAVGVVSLAGSFIYLLAINGRLPGID